MLNASGTGSAGFQFCAFLTRADYGIGAHEAMAELRPIRDDGVIPAQIGFQLAEVLCLTRWCDPEKPNRPPFAPGPTGRSGHVARMFACAVLLRARAELAHERLDTADDATLAQCLASAKVLGEKFSVAAARFLTWRIPRFVPEPLLHALGMLLLAVRLRSGRFAEPVLGELADWVIKEESRATSINVASSVWRRTQSNNRSADGGKAVRSAAGIAMKPNLRCTRVND
jgi:hypothetical protein